jgi:ribose transport system ATP-binding protein
MAAGVAYVPEDRAGEGIFPDLSVADNLMAGVRSQHARHGWVSARREQRAVKDLIKEFRIHCGSPRHELATLSGGNQQKVVIARWLHRKPKLLLLDEPSQGVDVLARADIDDSIRRFAADGMSVLVVTSDFNELARVCDRVVLLRRGRIVGEMARSELSEASITAQTYASVGV